MIFAPTEKDLFNIVASTHAADRIPLLMKDIEDTWSQKTKNPYAHGTFKALMYGLHNLQNSLDFPVKDINLITDIQKSEQSLAWLKELHKRMVEPIATSPSMESDNNAPNRFEIGYYRFKSAQVITQEAPPASLIPAIMHNWIKDIGKYHLSIKDKIDNPYAFTGDEAKELSLRAQNIPLFFSVVQPFSYGNQRLGRLVETIFRWKWNLPLVHYWPETNEHRKLLLNLAEYEKLIPEISAKAKDIK